MGGILRLLIIAAVVYLAYVWIRKLLNSRQHTTEVQKADEPRQLMKQCAFCQVHIPEGESTQSQGHFFCSEHHRDLFLQQQK